MMLYQYARSSTSISYYKTYRSTILHANIPHLHSPLHRFCTDLCYRFLVFLAASLTIKRKRLMEIQLSSLPSVGLSVGLSVRKVYCGKTADWIWMPFGMVSGIGRGMGVLDGVVIVEGKGQFWW